MDTTTMRLQWYSLSREISDINKDQLRLFLTTDVERIYYDEKENIYVEEVPNKGELLRVNVTLSDMLCYVSILGKVRYLE